MVEEIYANDPVLKNIDETIAKILNEEELSGHRKIPTREEILNTHIAFIKVSLL